MEKPPQWPSPPPCKNVYFIYFADKMVLTTWPSTTSMNCWLITSSSPLTKHWGWTIHMNGKKIKCPWQTDQLEQVLQTFACLKILKNICSLCVFGLLQIFFQLSNTCHRLMSWKTAPGERLTSAPRFWRTFASHKSHEDVSSRIIVRLRWAKLTPKDVLNLY